MDDIKIKLEERHTELVKIVVAFESLEKSEEWQTVRELVFDKALKGIERQLLNASLESPLDPEKIYKLQGEMAWARKYETNRFIETLKKELENINNQIK